MSLSSAFVLLFDEDASVVNFAVVALVSLTGALEGGVVGEPTATAGAGAAIKESADPGVVVANPIPSASRFSLFSNPTCLGFLHFNSPG